MFLSSFGFLFHFSFHFAFAENTPPPVEIETFKLNGAEMRFSHHGKLHLLVNADCLIEKNHLWEKNEKCQAIRKLKEVSLKKLGKALEGGANPGAVACLKVGGKSLIAVDSRSNQNSFCRFEDGSFVSSGTLHFYARQNDRLF